MTTSNVGEGRFTIALHMVANGEDTTEESRKAIIDLMQTALADGLPLEEQAMAYKILGDQCAHLSEFKNAYLYFKQAFEIKKSLSISPESEKIIWQNAYETMGLISHAIINHSSDPQEQISIYDEVIQFTDYPTAHLNVGVLHAERNEMEKARYHWEYLVNNEDRLKIYGDKYHDSRNKALENIRHDKEKSGENSPKSKNAETKNTTRLVLATAFIATVFLVVFSVTQKTDHASNKQVKAALYSQLDRVIDQLENKGQYNKTEMLKSMRSSAPQFQVKEGHIYGARFQGQAHPQDPTIDTVDLRFADGQWYIR